MSARGYALYSVNTKFFFLLLPMTMFHVISALVQTIIWVAVWLCSGCRLSIHRVEFWRYVLNAVLDWQFSVGPGTGLLLSRECLSHDTIYFPMSARTIESSYVVSWLEHSRSNRTSQSDFSSAVQTGIAFSSPNVYTSFPRRKASITVFSLGSRDEEKSANCDHSEFSATRKKRRGKSDRVWMNEEEDFYIAGAVGVFTWSVSDQRERFPDVWCHETRSPMCWPRYTW